MEKNSENKIEIPMLDKIRSVQQQSQVIADFLAYMEQRDMVICEYKPELEEYMPVRMNKDQMLALFFEIDLVQAEKEREMLLESVRTK